MGKNEWLFYVVLAGLSWGTYVPLIFYGGNELGGKSGARLMAILCVGVAYFVLAVLFPLYLFLSGQQEWPEIKTYGLIFSGLAGVAGAVGAICVVFATKAARGAAPPDNPDAYKVYIAPLIFGLAPVINVLVSMVWHPTKDHPFQFHVELPGWKLWVGILLVGIGAAMVLFSKEEAESKHTSANRPSPVATAVAEKQP
jgi:drug/metabolite transporter (DMT)-like permease